MPNDSALVTIRLLPSNFPNRQAFIRAVTKEARTQAEQAWKNRPASIRQRRGRPSEQDRTEDVIWETINERFDSVADLSRKRAPAKEEPNVLEGMGDLTQGKLIETVREKLDARNPKDGLTTTPCEDTVYKYAKANKLFDRTDPGKLTVKEAIWLAKHRPSKAQSLIQLSRVWTRHQIPEEILKALSTAKVSPPKK